MFIFAAATSSVVNLMVMSDEYDVKTTWSAEEGSNVAGYKIYYQHPNRDYTIYVLNNTSHQINDENQKVYTVSVQALSAVHLPSNITGPVTVRGE